MDAGRDGEEVMDIIRTGRDAGEDAGEDVDEDVDEVVGEDFGSQFLNDFGEGLNLDQSEEVPSRSLHGDVPSSRSNSDVVYIY